MDWGVTDTGFYAPGYSELLDMIQENATRLYGRELNFGKRTFNGLYFRILAWFGTLLFKIAEGIYHSGFVSTAYGASLFLLGKFIGIQRLEPQRAVGDVTIKGTAGTTIPEGFLVQTQGNIRFATLSLVTIPDDGINEVTVAVRAVYAGLDGNVDAETINKVTNPLPLGGITWVKNINATSGGRDRETEDEFRDRYEQSVDLPGGSNTDAIRAELLRTDSVTSAKVFENTTDHWDDNGLPLHGIEAIVLGGLDADITRAIFDRKAAGIQTWGNVENYITDLSGVTKEILFSRPEAVDVYVRITGLETENAPLDIVEQIKTAVVNHIGGYDADGNTVSGLEIGEEVIYKRVICPVNSVDGVKDYELELSTDGVNWSDSNIAISTRQVAQTKPALIEVS